MFSLKRHIILPQWLWNIEHTLFYFGITLSGTLPDPVKLIIIWTKFDSFLATQTWFNNRPERRNKLQTWTQTEHCSHRLTNMLNAFPSPQSLNSLYPYFLACSLLHLCILVVHCRFYLPHYHHLLISGEACRSCVCVCIHPRACTTHKQKGNPLIRNTAPQLLAVKNSTGHLPVYLL